jgi:hypothetical protein
MATKDKRLDPASDGPYQGKLGTSRLEHVHVPLPDGRVRSVAVYVAVNVASDPHLATAATSGALHRFEGGEELAVPFVFHDPNARKLCVVVPEVLRHRELAERAKLMTAIAEDANVPIPAYAREAVSVVGVRGLAEYLARSENEHRDREAAIGSREADAAGREDALRQREEALASREVRMRERAEHVTGREDELRQLAEENEAMGRDLAMREQELETRLADLADRERAHAQHVATPAAEPIVRPKSVPPPRTDPALRTIDEPPAPIAALRPSDVDDDVEDDVVEEIDDDLESVEGTSPGKAAPRRSDPDLVDPDEVAEEVEDALVREDITGVHRTEDEAPSTLVATPAQIAPRASAGPSMPEPLARGAQITVRVGEPLELAARLVKDDIGELEMLVSFVTDVGAPVIVLTLTDGVVEHTRRLPLDPRSAEDRRVLEILRRRFEARVVLFGPEGQYLRETMVSAERETNVARMLDRATRLRGEASATVDAAKERALGAPVALATRHPFGAVTDEAQDAAGALRAMNEIADWMAPEKLDQALLELSITEEAIDVAVTRVVERAVAHGLALPSVLADRAVGAGVASEPGALVTRQIGAFKKTLAAPDKGGLDDAQIASNWERLLAAASDHEVAIDEGTHDLAYRAIRAVRGDTTGSPALGEVDPGKLVEVGAPELVVMLDHPRTRRVAAIALAARGDAKYADALCKAVRKMPRSEVVRVVPRITKLGEEAGDAMIDGLSARKTFVRQAFALALGSLKLRRAVVPLLHLLTSEESDAWREVARVLGSFGNASFRTLQRQLGEAKAGDERYVRTLGYLANNGCEKAIGDLAKDKSDANAADLAVRALAMQADLRVEDERVHGKRSLDGADPWLAFSRRFFEELEGNAPEADLVDAE